ncbi:MAG: hypothetical protein WCA20_09710 [Candidatus Sulfotelmatobacter sp.]
MRSSGASSGDFPDRMSYADLLTLDDQLVMQHLQAGNADAFAVIFEGTTAWSM